jgi:hypothetical protein
MTSIPVRIEPVKAHIATWAFGGVISICRVNSDRRDVWETGGLFHQMVKGDQGVGLPLHRWHQLPYSLIAFPASQPRLWLIPQIKGGVS